MIVCTQGIKRVDSVDGLFNHDHVLTEDMLRDIVGEQAVCALLQLPARWVAAAAAAGHRIAAGLVGGTFVLGGKDRTCFARRYSPDTHHDEQPFTSFHFDAARVTINVAISGDDAVDGGRLLGVFDNAVQTITRSEGEATVHSSSLLHGVSMMRGGVRYSLIMFFDFVA
eukprot:3655517-Prymnesium_polylepis.2